MLQPSCEEILYCDLIIYPPLDATLHHPLAQLQAVFRRVLICIQLLVYWSVVVQYQTHSTETLNCLVDCVEEF